MFHRVVITGVGVAHQAGIEIEDFWSSLLSKKRLALPAREEMKGCGIQSSWFIPHPNFDPVAFGLSKRLHSIMNPNDKVAWYCTRKALLDAGYELQKSGEVESVLGGDDIGMHLGTGFASLEGAFESHRSICGLPSSRFHRMVIPETMPNSPAAWISILFSLHGESQTVNASCASGTVAIGEAYRKIKHGIESCVIAGGVECLADSRAGIMKGFDMLGALTKSEDGLPKPFSKERSGFLFSEGGGAVLILESLEKAKNRNAKIYGEITGYHASSDSYSILQMNPSGAHLLKLLELAVGGQKIDYYNAHGTGTEANDAIEAKVIGAVFGDKKSQPFISSTKGILGHTIGASGAFEAVVCALSVSRDLVHPNLLGAPLENLNLPEEPIETKITNTLSASMGFGGHNAILKFSKWEED